MVASESWNSLPFAPRPDFNQLFASLLKSRADSTAKKYVSEIKKIFAWYRTKQITLKLPFTISIVALYLFGLDQQRKPPASMVLVHAALKWLHSFVPNSSQNPLDNAPCKNFVESAKRTRGQPISKKRPVDANMLKKIIDKYVQDGASRKDLRLAALCCLGFAGFFRFSELSNIQPDHLTFNEEFVKVFVPKSKTDVYREGNYVYVSRTQSNYCPASMLEKYIDVAGLDLSTSLPLFRPLSKKKTGYSLRSGKLSYTTCREMFNTA